MRSLLTSVQALGCRFERLSEEDQDYVLSNAVNRLAEENEELAETLLRAVYYEESYFQIAADMGLATKGAVTKRKDRAIARMLDFIAILIAEVTGEMGAPLVPPPFGKMTGGNLVRWKGKGT